MSSADHVAAENELRGLVVKERYYRDSLQWEKLRNCYHPDASRTWLNISWFNGDVDAFIAGSKKMAQGGTASTHSVQPVEVQIRDDKALVIATGSINIRVTLDGVEYELVSHMRLPIRVEHTDVGSVNGGHSRKEWRIVRLEIIYVKDGLFPTCPIAGKPPDIILPEGARPSYKYLDYVLSRQGFSINKRLAGTDKEGAEEAMRLMKDSEQWLSEG